MAMGLDSVWDGIRGIVLDAVGTLIDPRPSVAQVYSDAARRQGVDLDLSVVRARFHQIFLHDETNESRGPLVTDEATELQRWRRIVGNVLPELPDTDRAFWELWEHFGGPGAWACFDDVGPALATFRESGFLVRIASNFDGRLRRVVAGLRGLSDHAGSLLISSEVGFRKPHAAFYRAVCNDLGLEPGRVLFVGDDLENDVLGAARAGLRSVLLDRRGRHREAAVVRVGDLVELSSSRGL